GLAVRGTFLGWYPSIVGPTLVTARRRVDAAFGGARDFTQRRDRQGDPVDVTSGAVRQESSTANSDQYSQRIPISESRNRRARRDLIGAWYGRLDRQNG